MHARTPLVLVLSCLAAPALAQYTIPWHTIDGGGGTSSGGGYTLSGTIGQADAGGVLTGGAYTLVGGFWAGFTEPCPADFDGNGVANVNDLLAFLGAFRTQDASADFDGSGVVNVNDLLGFLGAFRAGC